MTGPTGPGGGGSSRDVAFAYTFNTATSGDPGSGKCLFNNATFASATQFNISKTDGDSNGIIAFLRALAMDAAVNVFGWKPFVIVRDPTGAACFMFYITGGYADVTTYVTFSISPVLTNGTIANLAAVRVWCTTVTDFFDAQTQINGFTTANTLEVEAGTKAFRAVLYPDDVSRLDWVVGRHSINLGNLTQSQGAGVAINDNNTLIAYRPTGLLVLRKVTVSYVTTALSGARTGVATATLSRVFTDGGSISASESPYFKNPTKHQLMPESMAAIGGNVSFSASQQDTNPLNTIIGHCPATTGQNFFNDVLYDHLYSACPVLITVAAGVNALMVIPAAATSQAGTTLGYFEWDEWTLGASGDR